VNIYTYTKSPVSIDHLTAEITSSAITIALDHLQLDGIDALSVIFKAELPVADKIVLDEIIVAHTGAPMPDEASSVTIDGPKDAEGRQLTKIVATTSTWHYSPRSLDFYTSKYKSLYNRSHYGDGTIDSAPDMGDAYMSFFDAAGTEIIKGEGESSTDYQTRLSSLCTKTTVTFECLYDIDVFGAKMMIKNPPTERAYVWAIAAPDVPESYGGNVVFMGGGMNLSFFADKSCVEYDGKSSAIMRYDPVYHSGKILVMAKHEAGAQIGIQFIIQYYSAH